MRRHFVSGVPRALVSLSQEKSSGVKIDLKNDFEKSINLKKAFWKKSCLFLHNKLAETNAVYLQ